MHFLSIVQAFAVTALFVHVQAIRTITVVAGNLKLGILYLTPALLFKASNLMVGSTSDPLTFEIENNRLKGTSSISGKLWFIEFVKEVLQQRTGVAGTTTVWYWANPYTGITNSQGYEGDYLTYRVTLTNVSDFWACPTSLGLYEIHKSMDKSNCVRVKLILGDGLPAPYPYTSTEYTTTFTTTNSNGQSEVDSGIVDVSTNPDGKWTTHTSLFPNPTSTEYTTTFWTINSSGLPEEDSGIVDVVTNSDGKWTTSTSLFPPSYTFRKAQQL